MFFKPVAGDYTENKMLTKLAVFISAAALIALYSNCSGFEAVGTLTQTSVSSLSAKCPRVTPKNLRSIDQAVALINELPKPLSLDCFLVNLQTPLSVHNVNNPISAQPAVNAHNPRILIIQTPLILSVVPLGAGRDLLELSEIVSGAQSVKAELAFPITGPIVSEDAFSTIPLTVGAGTDCRFCHNNETLAGGAFPSNAYRSDIVKPLESQRITASAMKREATTCNPGSDLYRCEILNAVFVDGAAIDGAFP